MSSATDTPTISVIIPIYNESEMIPSLLEKLAEVARGLSRYQWELVMVDDGSSDDSVEKIERERRIFPGGIVVRRFSRNFGHQAALMAGLQKASGEAIIFIDADLQDPPELFSTFLSHYEKGCDVVYGIREQREATAALKLAYKLFYFLFQQMAEVNIPLDAGDFGLISRRTANIIRSMSEQDLLLRGLRCWVGFKQVGVPYARPKRAAGETKYTLRKLMSLAGSAFFGYSTLPLRISTGLGCGAVGLALIYGAYVLYGKITLNANPPGWTSLMLVVLALSGTQLISVGILGEYISRIYKQTLNRPLYVIENDRVL